MSDVLWFVLGVLVPLALVGGVIGFDWVVRRIAEHVHIKPNVVFYVFWAVFILGLCGTAGVSLGRHYFGGVR